MCEFHEPDWQFSIGDQVEFDAYQNLLNPSIGYNSPDNTSIKCRGVITGMCYVAASGSYYAYLIDIDEPVKKHDVKIWHGLVRRVTLQ